MITVLLTFLLLLFGEIMPKVYSRQNPLTFCRRSVDGILIFRMNPPHPSTEALWIRNRFKLHWLLYTHKCSRFLTSSAGWLRHGWKFFWRFGDRARARMPYAVDRSWTTYFTSYRWRVLTSWLTNSINKLQLLYWLVTSFLYLLSRCLKSGHLLFKYIKFEIAGRVAAVLDQFFNKWLLSFQKRAKVIWSQRVSVAISFFIQR